jgi:hypothetical protein
MHDVYPRDNLEGVDGGHLASLMTSAKHQPVC